MIEKFPPTLKIWPYSSDKSCATVDYSISMTIKLQFKMLKIWYCVVLRQKKMCIDAKIKDSLSLVNKQTIHIVWETVQERKNTFIPHSTNELLKHGPNIWSKNWAEDWTRYERMLMHSRPNSVLILNLYLILITHNL